ncbi:helicase, type I site-specific restriction-modification system restriction subunit [Belliella baltica DSM 15883]|uniref:Helicase, type I site-specific restriction-modification system restriction subunit n=1 Tax=Belliella baltica (strain DSM 15883 / CIP 108006 / LMG 21964 / BA134) TaxID=866536 RepID=I3ZA90_BELBD|nr:type I restriction-modification system endonuclease [Belliella baltica]AFL86158.1 helicase, type I site-specific restriction-modification system restriction subunit [Belliella baltica DSM 15883]
MIKSNFSYLETEFPILFNIGQSAEFNLYQDPITALFKLRQFGERISELLFDLHHLDFPYDNSFHNRLKTLEYENILPVQVKDLLHTIKHKGNVAVHQNKGSLEDAKGLLFSTFKISKWFYQTYSEENDDLNSIKFHLPDELDARHALHVLEQEFAQLQTKFDNLLEERSTEKLPQEKLQEIQNRSEKAARKIEMSEAETRLLIDEQLRIAGWEVDTQIINYKKNKTQPQRGKYLAIAEWPCGSKWADYALFVGTQLYGIVEAKKYASDISTDLLQSKTYAEHIQIQHEAELLGEWYGYKVPFLFSTNGRPYLEQIKTKSGVWFLDVRQKHGRSKALNGWYSPEGLIKLLEKDLKASEDKLKSETVDFLESSTGLGLRKYQIEAIKALEKVLLSNSDQNRALITMATGTGKTRTIIGLCYRLIQSNRFKRILFLVDRNLLATQAINSFKDNKIIGLNTFSEIYGIKEVTEKVPDLDTRLHFATVQGMVKRLFYSEGKDIPPVDQYDCIIIDEAHRGYLLDREMDDEELDFKDQRDFVSKYRMVLDYFDAFSIGLTATPALHTSEIFGPSVYTYSYREAVIDGFLIDHEPPYIIKTELGEEGITWEKGAQPKAHDRENNTIIELESLEDELKIDISGFNKKVITPSFNRTVIKELVNHLDPDGDEKSLFFAATDEHADMIVEYLKEEFANIGVDVADKSIEKITGKSYNPQEQLLRYKNEKYPNIAVTVDLLTTGIDVPPICNLVFMRRIKSRILYEQMLGRATRRCDEIGKEVFRIYDAVKIYDTLEDFTQMKPIVANPKVSFVQLVEELKEINQGERTQRQIDQVLAKIQRKRKLLQGNREDKLEQFIYNAHGESPDELLESLKNSDTQAAVEKIVSLTNLWKFLDQLKPDITNPYVYDGDDVFRGIDRGYGKAEKPEDYLDNFARFIQENQNKIEALKIVCTRPTELDRKSLRELMLVLDQEGYNANTLNVAWRAAKNDDIAADIISYIRTLSIGSSLVSHENRVKNAVNKIRQMKDWNKTQTKWIDRFEKQLLKETVLRKEDLDQDPFDEDGGFDRLNKIFEEQLEEVIAEINRNLYA